MNIDESCERAAREISDAQAVIIGASNGLSISEGFNVFADNKWFREGFGDFRSRYGIRSVIEAASFPFPSDEAYWGFWSRLINMKTFGEPLSQALRSLSSIVGKRPCFIVTTNAEGHFQQAGFEDSRVFEMEGGFRELACNARCGAAPVPSEIAIKEMAAHELDGRVPPENHPRCEKCGAPMRVNSAADNSFFQTPEWTGKLDSFKRFLRDYAESNVAILELGVGMRNPLVSGALAEAKRALAHPSVVVVNKGCGAGLLPDGIICIDDDITHALKMIEKDMGR